jgi:hypothetical protein
VTAPQADRIEFGGQLAQLPDAGVAEAELAADDHG